MTRIATITEVITQHGGTVVKWYSDGAKYGPASRWPDGKIMEWKQTEWPSYKLVLDIEPDALQKVLDELNVWGALAYDVRRAYITRKYREQGGHLKVVFNSAYCDFKRGIKS